MTKTNLLLVVLALVMWGCGGSGHFITRLDDVASGQTSTVRVRSGNYAVSHESPGVHAFTVRDNYDKFAIVRTNGDYPKMGITLDITGKFSRSGKDTIIDATNIADSFATPWIPIGAAGVVLLAVAGFGVYRISRPVEDWGFLDVVSGKETKKEFVLRGKSISIGREPEGKEAIQCFFDDQSVSRMQGVLTRKGTQIFYQNKSANGTVVDGERVGKNEKALVYPGTAIEMGIDNAVLRYRPKGLRRVDPDKKLTIGPFDVAGEETTVPPSPWGDYESEEV